MKKLFNSRPLMSHMRLRKIGPTIIGSMVRDTISCAFIPHSVGANLVRLRHGTKSSPYSLKATTPTLETRTWLGL